MCLCNKKFDFIFLLPTAMSFLTGNHTMDLFHLVKKNSKNILLDLLAMGINFEDLSYLSNCSLSQIWRFWRIHSKVLQGIESNLTYAKVSGIDPHYILRSESLWHPLSSSILKNKRIFLLVTSKLMSAFSLWMCNMVRVSRGESGRSHYIV